MTGPSAAKPGSAASTAPSAYELMVGCSWLACLVCDAGGQAGDLPAWLPALRCPGWPQPQTPTLLPATAPAPCWASTAGLGCGISRWLLNAATEIVARDVITGAIEIHGTFYGYTEGLSRTHPQSSQWNAIRGRTVGTKGCTGMRAARLQRQGSGGCGSNSRRGMRHLARLGRGAKPDVRCLQERWTRHRLRQVMWQPNLLHAGARCMLAIAPDAGSTV